MEVMVFYWTGAVIWWVVSLFTVFTFIFAAVIFPIVLYRKMEKYFWQWKWAAIAASTGMTQRDVEFCIRVPGGTPNNTPIPEMIKWFMQVKKRGEALKRLDETERKESGR